jgi:hypothetical protein
VRHADTANQNQRGDPMAPPTNRQNFSLFKGWVQTSLPGGRVEWRQMLPKPPIRGVLGIDAMGALDSSALKASGGSGPDFTLIERPFAFAGRSLSLDPLRGELMSGRADEFDNDLPESLSTLDHSSSNPMEERNASFLAPAVRAQLLPPEHPVPGSERTQQLPDGTIVVTARRRNPQGNVLRLSNADVLNLKKTLQTEWMQRAGTNQAKGIIDTILNRVASGHWGSTVSNVVNARKQFSDINGPVAWKRGRRSVEEYPQTGVSKTVDDLVDSYLAERASGGSSSVGTHLNYANPYASDRKNLPWIMKLDGPVYGAGKAIHRHGTADALQQYRPKHYSLALP